MTEPLDVAAVQQRLRRFAAARDWEKFHNPKNLAMALVVEASEVAEIFQWLTADEAALAPADAERWARIADEIADVAIYLVRLADIADIDLASAVEDKITRNEQRFPPSLERRSVSPSDPSDAAHAYRRAR